MNLEKVIFGFFVLLAATLNFGFFLGDKRSLPPDLVTTVRTGLRVLAMGSPAWGLLRGDDARALFYGFVTREETP